MHLAQLKTPRVYLPLVLLVVLAAVSAVLFHPGFQRKMLLDHVGPLVDALEIEEVHLTPWSLGVKGLAVRYAGGTFQLTEGHIGFCLSSLVVKTLHVPKVSLTDLLIDLTKFQAPEPDEPDSGPFEGVLALLDFGFGLRLDEAMIDARVLLEGGQSVVAKITGGGVRTDASGVLEVEARLDTGQGSDRVEVRGDVTIAQLAGGKYRALEADLGLTAALEALPERTRMRMEVKLSPAPSDSRQAAASPAASGAAEPRIAREDLDINLALKDEGDRDRSTIGLAGIYDGSSGIFDGTYRLTANERLVQPFLKDRKLPPTQERISGEVLFDTDELTGEMTVKSDMKLSDLRNAQANDKLPAGISIKHDLRVKLLPGRELRVETLDSGVYDDTERKALASRLPADVHIRLDDIEGFLAKDQTLLELDLPEIPLTWFDVLLPDLDITGGTLQAAFEVTTDTSAAIHLKPTKAFRISGLEIRRGAEALVEDLDLSVLPVLTYEGKALRLVLHDLKLATRDEPLASASLDAMVSLTDPNRTSIAAKADADVYLDPLLPIEARERRGLPRDVSLAVEGEVALEPAALTLQALKAGVSQGRQAEVLQAELRKPIEVQMSGEATTLRDAEGELAEIRLGKFDLGWLSAFLPGSRIAGELMSGKLSVTGHGGRNLRVASRSPIRIGGLSVTGKEGPLLRDLDISLRPELDYAPDGVKIAYSELSLKSGSAELIGAAGELTLPAAMGKRTAAEGRVVVDVRALAEQPGIARILEGGIDSPVRVEADYDLAKSEDLLEIQRLAANLYYADGPPRISLQNVGGLRAHTGAGGPAERRASGRVTLEIRDLSPGPFAKIMQARGLTFDEMSGKATLESDGAVLSLKAVEPFVLKNVAVMRAGNAVLRPFSVKVAPAATLRGEALRARIDGLSVAFAGGYEKRAVNATADLTLELEPVVRLGALSCELTASLPDVLEQPALLPGHTLKAGELRSTLRWYPSGRLQSSTKIQGLEANEILALSAVDVPIDGQIRHDGTFSFSMPIRAQGKSGATELAVQVSHRDAVGGPGTDRLEVKVDSKAVYLNDVLGTLRAIEGERSDPDSEQATSPEKPDEPAAPSREPDARAVWDVLPHPAYLDLDVGRLFYTDYLEIRDIKGVFDLGPDALALRDFAAHFHDSPITADGTLAFTAGQASPYDLKLKGEIERLNLAEFLRELVPGSTPRAEGLFDVKLDAFGSAPNLPQYRNDLFFDMRLQSRDGVFRPLEPDSVLIAGSSNFAGAFGEGVSFVPTGLFGLGAVSRLVNYIREIPYDRIDIHVVRDESRDLQIKRYVVQSPSILMTAKGGIDYEAGKDVLDSPLSLTVQLDMRNKGAAILHSLDLLKPEKDPYGYWVGPAIKVSGTFFKTQSNLEAIISKAGNGALLGGVTRPVAGLWGNLKYHWMDEGEPLEYKE